MREWKGWPSFSHGQGWTAPARVGKGPSKLASGQIRFVDMQSDGRSAINWSLKLCLVARMGPGGPQRSTRVARVWSKQTLVSGLEEDGVTPRTSWPAATALVQRLERRRHLGSLSWTRAASVQTGGGDQMKRKSK